MVSYKNHTVPVEVNSEYIIHGVVLAIIAIVIILGILLLVYHRERNTPVIQHKIGNFTAKIHNTTGHPVIFTSKSGTTTIKPNEVITTTVVYHDKLQADIITTTGNKLNFKTSLSSVVSDLYITDSGFGHPDNTNKHVTLVNNSDEDVVFALVSKHGGIRFPTTVLANSTVSNVTIVKGQKWHVIKPKDPQNVITEKIIRFVPTIIYFDGKKLITE